MTYIDLLAPLVMENESDIATDDEMSDVSSVISNLTIESQSDEESIGMHTHTYIFLQLNCIYLF